MTFDEHVLTFLDDLTDLLECRDLAKAAIAADIREQKLLATRHVWAAKQALLDGNLSTHDSEWDMASVCTDRIHRGVLALHEMEQRKKVVW